MDKDIFVFRNGHVEQTIIEGDCLEVMPTLPRNSFDLLLTDPPYAMPAKYYISRSGKHKRKWSDTSIMQTWWRVVIEAVVPLMKPNGMIISFCNAQAMAVFWPIMYEASGNTTLAVWEKGAGVSIGNPLGQNCEYMIVGSLGTPFHNGKTVGNVFKFPRISSSKRVHPAQKPGALIERLVSYFCPEGGNVLDPFARSCVVANMCERTGRSSTCIEWDASEHERPQALLLPGAPHGK